ncbi:unnamed protein product [Albugo candida]|uniref:Uncharacterized protein n=1 Tax=Albugo candida TaxID=65357 RepID=A0A024GW03_9STRA|nr:unnamed protein product [Albugo candida]|eukprot:CCI50797.1 unnamed protein product [Albugo candida]
MTINEHGEACSISSSTAFIYLFNFFGFGRIIILWKTWNLIKFVQQKLQQRGLRSALRKATFFVVHLLVHLIKEHKSTCSIVYSTHAEEKILALEKDDFQAVLITFVVIGEIIKVTSFNHY